MKAQIFEDDYQLESISSHRRFFIKPFNSTIVLFYFFAFLFLATPLLLLIDVNSLIVISLCLTFFGLAGDVYQEIIYASKSKKDNRGDTQKSAVKLLFEIVKQSHKLAFLNYFMAICILILVFLSYKFADISSTERFVLMLLVFISALLSIMIIWLLRILRK
jgi:hypothetical protein